jgi:hypothetical protein
MNLTWPRFHDSSFRPSLREQWDIHWRANLRMLRRPWDLVFFNLISFSPLLLLMGLMWLFPDLFEGSGPDLSALLLTTVVTAAIFFTLQHVAFVVAMNLTYVPHVHAVLRDRGVPVCGRCGHRLPPATPKAACSECGHTDASATMCDSPGVSSMVDAPDRALEDSQR